MIVSSSIPEVCQYLRHRHRMDQIRFTRFSQADRDASLQPHHRHVPISLDIIVWIEILKLYLKIHFFSSSSCESTLYFFLLSFDIPFRTLLVRIRYFRSVLAERPYRTLLDLPECFPVLLPQRLLRYYPDVSVLLRPDLLYRQPVYRISAIWNCLFCILHECCFLGFLCLLLLGRCLSHAFRSPKACRAPAEIIVQRTAYTRWTNMHRR